jgi:hypothetical protein
MHMSVLRGIAEPIDCSLPYTLLAYWRKLLIEHLHVKTPSERVREGAFWCLVVGDGRLARSRGIPAVCRPRSPAVHAEELVRLGATVVGVVRPTVGHTE